MRQRFTKTPARPIFESSKQARDRTGRGAWARSVEQGAAAAAPAAQGRDLLASSTHCAVSAAAGDTTRKASSAQPLNATRSRPGPPAAHGSASRGLARQAEAFACTLRGHGESALRNPLANWYEKGKRSKNFVLRCIPFDTWAGAFRAGNSVLIDRVDDVSIGPVSPRALTALP